MKFRRFAVIGLATTLLGLASGTPALAEDPLATTGTACGSDEGVTIVVDFAPAIDEVKLGCAEGPQDSILQAMAAAGFTAGTEPSGPGNYLCSIDNVVANPANCLAYPAPYWASWVNTQNGNLTDAPVTTWESAQVGVDGGPVAVGTVVGFRQAAEYPGETPRFALASLAPPDNSPLAVPTYGPSTGNAIAVAGWIGRQLQADGGLLGGSVGDTSNAVYALAAAGVGGDQIAQSAAAIFASGPSYIGPADAVAANYAKIAKVALALQIAGLDPTAFPDGAGGTRDLLSELRSVVNPDGSFGDYDDPFLHPYVLFVLSRTVTGVPESSVSWLESQQCTDPSALGSFGYDGCATADPDYTALAVQGLLAAGVDSADPVIESAVAWLKAQQVDGGIAGNTNSTGLVGQVFTAVGADDAASQAAGYVGGLQIGCAQVLAAGSALVDGDVGAIAWKPESLADAIQFGIDDGNLGQFQISSGQAIFALGTPLTSDLTAAGADPALPAAAVCAPPSSTTTTSSPSVSSSSAMVSISSVTTSRSSATKPAAVLAATGTSDRTGPEVLVALLLLTTGTGLVIVARRRGAVRKH